MEVNVTTTNAVIKEVEAQRNNALSRCAHQAAEIAVLREALESAQERIKELEKEKADKEAADESEQRRDAA